MTAVPKLLYDCVINALSHTSGNKGNRFDENFLKVAVYFYVRSGKAFYEFLLKNFNLPSVITIKRYINKSISDVNEGKVCAEELYKFLIQNNYPLVVSVAEDGTKITEVVEYCSKRNVLCGICSPLGENGIPSVQFKALTAKDIQNFLINFPRTKYMQVVLAQPIAASKFNFF